MNKSINLKTIKSPWLYISVFLINWSQFCQFLFWPKGYLSCQRIINCIDAKQDHWSFLPIRSFLIGDILQRHSLYLIFGHWFPIQFDKIIVLAVTLLLLTNLAELNSQLYFSYWPNLLKFSFILFAFMN